MVVFSTNVAETSVTIPGIKYVIDSGMAKENKYDKERRMNVIVNGNITRASAIQVCFKISYVLLFIIFNSEQDEQGVLAQENVLDFSLKKHLMIQNYLRRERNQRFCVPI